MSTVNQIQHQIITPLSAVLTVANSTTISAAVELFGTSAVGLITPESLTSTSLTFLVSVDGANYVQLRDLDNNLYSVTVSSTAGAYPLQPSAFASWRFLKIVCGTAEVSDKTFKIIPFSV